MKHAQAIALFHDVQIIHIRLGSEQPDELGNYQGQPVDRLSISVKRPLRALRQIRKLRRRLVDVDVLHTMAFSAAIFGALAVAFNRRPWVHTEHWSGVANPQSVSPVWVAFAWSRYVLRSPGWLTGVTTQLASVLERYGRSETTSVVPCVVENPLPVSESHRDGPCRLVAVGYLVGNKRPMLAVQTVRWLLDHGTDVEMTWVGDGPLRSDVERKIKQLALDERFIITGFVPPDDVFGYLQDSNLFFLPTKQENFLTAAAEALSAGRPVVLPWVGGFDDYVDETNGILVTESSAEALGVAIQDAIARFEHVSAVELAEPIRARFSPRTVGEQFNEIYRRLSA